MGGVLACGGDQNAAPGAGNGFSDSVRITPTTCTTPNQGCPCADEGKRIDCGTVAKKLGSYVLCSAGTRVCQNSAWGPCEGEATNTSAPAAPSYAPLAVGASTTCPDNPCDPYCNRFQDNFTGINPGPGLVVDNGAITLPAATGAGGAGAGSPCTSVTISPDTPSLALTPGPAQLTQGGLLGEYLAGNLWSGTPYASVWQGVPLGWGTLLDAPRIDPALRFFWANGPDINKTGINNYSVRWQGKIRAPATGSYAFSTLRSKGYFRLTVNGVVVLKFVAGSVTVQQNVSLQSGQLYDLYGEFAGDGTDGVVDLRWSATNGATTLLAPNTLIPPQALYTQRTDASFVTTPSSIAFTATPAPAGCGAGVVWSTDRPDVATLDPQGVLSFFSTVGGPINVRAYVGGAQAQTIVQGNYNALRTTAAPAGVTDASFSSATPPADAGRFLYPYNNTVFPLGLRAPLVQWENNGQTANAVKVSLRYPPAPAPALIDYQEIVPNNGFTYQIPQGAWELLEQAAAGTQATLTLQRTSGGTALRPMIKTINFATGALRGRIYYSTYAKPSGEGLRVVDPSLKGSSVDLSVSGCPMCHTVSASGNTLVTSDEGSPKNALRVNRDGSLAPLADPISPNYGATGEDWKGFAWAAITPDGQYVLNTNNFWGNTYYDSIANGANGGDNGNGGSYIIWKMPTTPGAALNVSNLRPNNWGLGNAVMMLPSFSPDGTKLVFINGDGWGGSGWRKGISLFDFNQSAMQFSNRRLLLNHWPNGLVIKFPVFENDSRTILYQTTTPLNSLAYIGQPGNSLGGDYFGGTKPSDNGTSPGKLWSVDAASAAPTSVELKNINLGERAWDNNKSYCPTVLPQSVGGYRWTILQSTRPYGNLLNVDPTKVEDYSDLSSFKSMAPRWARAQLWIAAIDDTPSSTSDRSHPPFRLPNQEMTASNERGSWVLAPCVPVGTSDDNFCTANSDCCESAAGKAVCQLDRPLDPVYPVRHCTATLTPSGGSCGPSGSACTVDADCCSGLYCSASGSCQVPNSPPALTTANYVRAPDYDASSCAPGTQTVWRLFQWQSETPGDSYIEFFLQTADDPTTFSTLPLAPTPVSFPDTVSGGIALGATTTAWTSSPDGKTVDDKLLALGSISKRYLRLTARFMASSDGVQAPRLGDWRVTYSCVPSE